MGTRVPYKGVPFKERSGIMSPLASHLPIRSDSTMVRLFREDDVAAFLAYRSDPELARYQGWSPMSGGEARAFVARMARATELVAGDWIQLAIAHASTDVLLGDLGIFLAGDLARGEVGFTLAASGQGQGHATRAVSAACELLFAVNGSLEVYGVTDTRNTASMGVLERAGFVHVATQRSVSRNEPCTEAVYRRRRGGA